MISIPLDVIVAWSDDERREARTWALLRMELGGEAIELRPACLAQAAQETKEVSA